MARQRPSPRELTISFMTAVSSTPNENVFVECATDAGRAAFWGSPANTRNISQLQQRKTPFRVRCGCITPSQSTFPGHDLWIPQTEVIEFLD